MAGQTRQQKPQQAAAWYFIGAVFIFTAPGLFFDDLEGWARAPFFILGILVMVAGFVQMRREVRANRRSAAPHGPDRTGPGGDDDGGLPNQN